MSCDVIKVSKTWEKNTEKCKLQKKTFNFFLLWSDLEKGRELYTNNNDMIFNFSMNLQLLLICAKRLKNNLQK